MNEAHEQHMEVDWNGAVKSYHSNFHRRKRGSYGEERRQGRETSCPSISGPQIQ